MMKHLVDLSVADKAFVVDEFGRAKGRLGLMLQAKFACFEILPLKLMGLAHFDEGVARAAAQDIVRDLRQLRSGLCDADWGKTHLQIRWFADHIDELEQFASGLICRAGLPALCQERIRRYACIQINETGVEACHALAKSRLSRRAQRNPTPQLFSTELRFVEFQKHSQDCTAYSTMQTYFEICRSPSNVVQTFGL